MAKYHNFGTNLNRNKARKIRSSVTNENIETIPELLENNPHASPHQSGLVLSASSFNRIARKEIRWCPYQIRVRQQ